MSFTRPAAARRHNVAAGDVVAFVFPSGEGDIELEKARPSLVLHVAQNGDDPLVTVAYGTSRRTAANAGHELHVRKPADLESAGLHRRTRFIGARTVQVPLSSWRFITGRTGTAILGHLPDNLHQRLAQVAALALQNAYISRRSYLRRPRRDKSCFADAIALHYGTEAAA